ncbi:MAG: PAS domain S-box protein [bacterium]
MNLEAFRRIVEHSPDLIAIVDADGLIQYANGVHLEHLGTPPEVLLGSPVLELVHPDDRATAALALSDTYDGEGAKGAIPFRLKHANGSWVRVTTDGGRLHGESDGEVFFASRVVSTTEGFAGSELARLSAMLRAQQETTPDGVLVVSATGETISFNQNYLELWGLSAEQADAGRGVRTPYLANQLKDPSAILAQVDSAYEHPSEPFGFLVELLDGRRIDVHSAPFGQAETAQGRVWFFRDVTERVQAEQTMRESEERYRRLVELSPNAIAVHVGGVIRYANAAALRLVNLSNDEIVGKNVFAFVHPDDHRTVMLAAMERDFDTPRFVEARLVRLDGRELTVEMGSSATTIDGQTATQTVMRDITERRDAERALRESEERYRSLVENAPDAIFVHDGATVIYSNQAAATMLGFESPEEVVGIDPWTMFGGMERSAYQQVIARVLAGETLQSSGPRFFVFAEREADVELSLAPARYSGKPVIQVIMRDVTERRIAADERLALERKLLETQKLESLGVLAGGIAHDFNNLLVTIMGNAGMAMSEVDPGSNAATFLAEIETASQRAADLARQMLAYSGKGRFVVERLNLSVLARETAHLVSVSLPGSVVIEFSLSETLPVIEADATQLRQIIMNLVINAGEAIGDSPGEIRLETGTRTVTAEELQATHGGDAVPGEFVFLKVSDTGCGMDPSTLAKVFEPFFSTKFTGRGLGLAAVLGIVRGHLGAIRADSISGTGTTFELLLPLPAQLPPASPA